MSATGTRTSDLRVVVLSDPAQDMPHSYRTFLRDFLADLDAAGVPHRVVSPRWPMPFARGGPPHLALSAFYRHVLYPLTARWSVDRQALTFVLSTGLAQILRFAPRGRTVMFCHDVFAFLTAAELGHTLDFGGSSRTRLLAGLQKPFVRRADLVIVPSEATRRDLRRTLGVDDHRIVVIPHRVDRALFSPGNRAAARLALKLAAGDEIVMAIVTPERRKNVPRLLDALERLAPGRSHLHLLLVGALAPVDERRAASGVLAGRVTRLQDVPDATIADAYRAATCLAHVSLYEGFGYPVLEAMASGCAVVASDRGAVAEIASTCAELTDATSPAAIAASIARVLDDSAHRASLVEAGLRRADDYSNPRGYAACLEKLWTA